MIDFGRRRHGWSSPGVENGELSGANPPTLRRLRLWQAVAITVQGRPDWLFIKLHCHGMTLGTNPQWLGRQSKTFCGNWWRVQEIELNTGCTLLRCGKWLISCWQPAMGAKGILATTATTAFALSILLLLDCDYLEQVRNQNARMGYRRGFLYVAATITLDSYPRSSSL